MLFCKFLCRPYTTIKVFSKMGTARREILPSLSGLVRVWPSLLSSNINSLLLSNWATWDNREMVSKDAESIFQRHFHGRRRCLIVRPLVFRPQTDPNSTSFPGPRAMELRRGCCLVRCRVLSWNLNRIYLWTNKLDVSHLARAHGKAKKHTEHLAGVT